MSRSRIDPAHPVRDKHRVVDPDIGRTAECVERIRRLNAARDKNNQRRAAMLEIARDPAQVATLGLKDMRGLLSRREFEVALMTLGGMAASDIAHVMGLSSRGVVSNIVVRPHVKRFIQLVDQEQLERVCRGEFGVKAQAKAYAPKVMSRMGELAGAVERDGQPHGRAKRDSDVIAAGKTVLTVSGDLREQKDVHHVHELLQTMSTEELTGLVQGGKIPERLARAVPKLLPAPTDAEKT